MTGVALIVGGGGLQGLPVLRSVRAMGWKAIVADTISDNINRFEADAYFVAPPVADLSEFSEFLHSLVIAERVDAVFPTTMYDLPVLASMRLELESLGVRVFASAANLVSTLEDKQTATEAADAAHLPVLPSIDPKSHDFSFPLIGKPRRGWGGKGILYAADYSEYAEIANGSSLDGYLWQRHIKRFREWSVDFAIGHGGDVSYLIKRLRVRASGGYAVISEIVENAGPERDAKETALWLARAGGLGLFNIQFLEEDGRYRLTDINPRAGTSSVSALAAGSNLVDYLLTGRRELGRGGYLVRTLRDTFIGADLRGARGVVFDLDETVIDQKSWMAAKLDVVIKTLSEELQDPVSFKAAALQIIDEGPWDRLIDHALQRANLPSTLAPKLISAWRTAWPSFISVHSDAQGLADDLTRKGVPIAIVTDNPAASQRQKLDRLPSSWGRAPVVLTDEISAPKPAIQGFRLAAEKLGIPAEDLVYIGDSPWRDAIGALKAGYRGVIIVQRPGAMHNASRQLLEANFPQFGSRISWVSSLSGLGHLIDGSR